MTINFMGQSWQTPPDDARRDCIAVRPGFLMLYNFALCRPFYEVRCGSEGK